MKLVYIAAPYRAKTIIALQENINNARYMAQYYWLRGDAVICPHLNSANFDGLIPDYRFLEGTKLMLSKCSLAVFHPDFRDSKGCCEELIYCRENGIRTLFLNQIQFEDMIKIVQGAMK